MSRLILVFLHVLCTVGFARAHAPLGLPFAITSPGALRDAANNLPVVTYTRGNDLSGSLQGAGGIGGLLARTENGLWLSGSPGAHAYYHADGGGNITCMVNASNAVVARYNYDPYGGLQTMSGPLASANLYRFSSKEQHANSRFYYYGYRFYDVGWQRWLNQDPMGEAGGVNLYGFAGNNPMGFVDPYGLLFESYFEAAGGWLYDAMMNTSGEGGYDPDSYAYQRAAELGTGSEGQVLKGVIEEGTRLVGGASTDYLAGQAAGAVVGKAAGGLMCKLKPLQQLKRLFAAADDIGETLGSATPATKFMGDAARGEGEILSRLGTSRESAARLSRKAAEAEEQIGIHGVSTTAGRPVGPASQAARDAVESKFPVHNTPTRNDPLHRTVELPKPVTPKVANEFNKVFSRE